MASRRKRLRIGQIPGISNKVSLRIHLGLESFLLGFVSLGSDLLLVWNSLKVTGTVGVVVAWVVL
jgi:hypothetical protein